MKSTGLSILLVLGLANAAWSQPAAFDDRPKITVSGEASVHVEPDRIVITLGIETWDKDITVAKQQNNEILRATIAVARELEIADKDVQTDHLSIQPRWHDEPRTDENFLGYFVRNTLVVTLSDTAQVETFITRALSAGVQYIHGVDFQTTELKRHREHARELALTAAEEKAEKMSAVLGRSVGAPIDIRETYAGSPWSFYSSWSGWGYGRSRGMSQNNVQVNLGGSGEIADTLALGKMTVRASVTVTFELAD